MAKKLVRLFILLFFLTLNFSISSVKTAFVERVLFFLLFISLYLILRHIDLKRIFILLTAVISPIIFLYGIIQKFILFPIYLDSMDVGLSTYSIAARARIESGRIFSLFSLPTLYTFICAVLLLAIFHYMINSKNISIRAFWIILFIVGIFNMVLTQSFAGILYLVVGFPVYLYFSGRSNLKFLVPLLMILSMFLFIITGLRFSEARKLDPVKLRVSNWNQAVRMTGSSPVLGVGLGNYEHNISKYILPGEAHSIYSHNFFLQLTAEGGVVTLLMILSLLIIYRKKIIPEINKDNAIYISILIIIILYNLIDIGFYFFSASLIFTLIISQIYRVNTPAPKIAVYSAILLILPQLLIFISAGQRKSGSFHLNFKRLEKAEVYFKRSLKFNKFNYKALQGLAETSYSTGNISRADEYLIRILDNNDFNPYAHYLRSRILYGKKKYLTSLYHAGKAESLNNKNPEYRNWYNYIKSSFTDSIKKSELSGGKE
ncbi:MAG: O-antigen ligase family protein [Acidobacteriota bacterium]